MKKKFTFLLLTLLAIIGFSPDAYGWVIGDVTKVTGYNIANPSAPSTNLNWNNGLDQTNAQDHWREYQFYSLTDGTVYLTVYDKDKQYIGGASFNVGGGADFSTADKNNREELAVSGVKKGGKYKATLYCNGSYWYMKVELLSLPAVTPYIYIDGNSTAFTKSGSNWVYTFDASANKEFRLQNENNTTALGSNVSNVALCPDGATYNASWTWNPGTSSLSEYGNYSGKLKVAGGYKYTITINSAVNSVTLARTALAVESKTYTATLNLNGRTDINAVNLTVTGATPAVTNKAMTKSSTSFSTTFESTTVPTKATYSWTGGSVEQDWTSTSTSNTATAPELVQETGMVFYLVGEINENKFVDSYKFSEKDGIYTLSGITMDANKKWKLSKVEWDIVFDANNLGKLILKGFSSSTNAYNTNDYNNIAVNEEMENATFIYDSGAKTLTIINGSTVPTIGVNMPLKAADFENGQSHYFLVGFRTAGWRLQPEWELTKVDATHYALPENQRLMYNQYFGIAKVDTYDDYIHQRYTMYYYPSYMVLGDANNSVDRTIELTANRANQGYVAVTEHEWDNHKGNSMVWYLSLNKGELPSTGELKLCDDQIRWSYPSLLKQFQITVNAQGVPQNLTVKSSQARADIANNSVFTLVGDGIRSTDKYKINGQKKTVADATYTFNHLNLQGWSVPWVQYDAEGRPYVDANGNTMFQTAYDAHYLAAHPSQFDYDLPDGTHFPYTSEGITFVNVNNMTEDELKDDEYRDLYNTFRGKAHNFESSTTQNITSPEGTFVYKEKWNAPGDGHEAKINDKFSNDQWYCFVVKDVWIRGSFKIWSGWGGNLKWGEGDGVGYENGSANDNIRKAARWFPANGGHGTLKTEKAVYGGKVRDVKENEEANVYGCRMDVDAANFNINGVSDNEVHYYKRIILWYPGEKCALNSSVLQLVIDEGGPSIQARRKVGDKNHLQYRWNIPNPSGSTDVIDQYTIIRRNTKTLETSEVASETGVEIAPSSTFTLWLDDEDELAPGEYEYEITIHYSDADVTKTAISNPVWIYADAMPVTLTAAQRKEGDMYSFDLVLTPAIRNAELDRVSESTGKTGRAMAKNIVITPANDYTKTAINAAQGNNAVANGWTINADGSFSMEFAKASTMKAITINNIAPTTGITPAEAAYKFTAELTYDDGDKAGWNELQYVTASTSADIYAPTTKITLSTPTLEKITTSDPREAIANQYATQDGLHESHWFLPAGSHDKKGNIANPALYTRFNELQAKATIDELKVTSSVLDYWNPTYSIDVTTDGKTGTVTIDGAPKSVTIHGLPVNTNAVDDISGVSGDLRHEVAGNGAATAKAQIKVQYTFNSISRETALSAGSQVNYTVSVKVPTYTVGSTAYYQKDFAEANQASTDNDRSLAFAEFVGTIGNLDENLNYYIGYNFTNTNIDETIENIKDLKSGGFINPETGKSEYAGYQLYLEQMVDMAAQGGRVVSSREAQANSFGADYGLDYEHMPHYDFASLYAGNGLYVDPYTYVQSWTVANHSWTEKFTNSLPIVVGPVAEGAKGSKLGDNVKAQTINGKISVVYPVHEGLSVENTSTTSASSMQRAPKAHTLNTVDLGNVKALSALNNGNIAISLSNAEETTGIDEISSDMIDGNAEFYNLQGIRVEQPASGNIYIMRVGATASKVLYK